MAETVTEVPDTLTETERNTSSTQLMGLKTLNASDQAHGDTAANGGESNSKRAREDGTESEKEDNGGVKKQKVEKLEGNEAAEVEELGRVSLGPKSFGSSVEMFDYFYKFLHYWPPNLNANKYEHMVLFDLLKKGHLEPEEKIGKGIHAFQVRFHPQWKSRCFFLVRNDESFDDFSFRKCVDHIIPLPEDMQIKAIVNRALGRSNRDREGEKASGGGVGGGGGGGGCGRGLSRGRGPPEDTQIKAIVNRALGGSNRGREGEKASGGGGGGGGGGCGRGRGRGRGRGLSRGRGHGRGGKLRS
ncbi:protein EMBRYO DEFECTIVE 514-like [Cornus florida]|uniref:protein EMBRYO DEFECTIVE 514-like n=1 Tax=Cornus florida TaxID=4283 RepID=UPI0028981FF3|nr:protein EMBRYO DEFECTIVE 514-like [Cornus florida]